jgi:hypothetical protein
MLRVHFLIRRSFAMKTQKFLLVALALTVCVNKARADEKSAAKALQNLAATMQSRR